MQIYWILLVFCFVKSSVAEPESVEPNLFETWSQSRSYLFNKYLLQSVLNNMQGTIQILHNMPEKIMALHNIWDIQIRTTCKGVYRFRTTCLSLLIANLFHKDSLFENFTLISLKTVSFKNGNIEIAVLILQWFHFQLLASANNRLAISF